VGELLDREITLETPDRAVVELHETPLECRRLDAEMLGNARRRLRQRLVAHLEHALAHGTRARHVRPPRPRRSRGIALVLERRARVSAHARARGWRGCARPPRPPPARQATGSPPSAASPRSGRRIPARRRSRPRGTSSPSAASRRRRRAAPPRHAAAAAGCAPAPGPARGAPSPRTQLHPTGRPPPGTDLLENRLEQVERGEHVLARQHAGAFFTAHGERVLDRLVLALVLKVELVDRLVTRRPDRRPGERATRTLC